MGEKETSAEATNLNSSKSNRIAESGEDIAIDEEGVQRSAGAPSEGIAIGEEGLQRSAPSGGGPRPAEATNLNSSRSNIYRTAGGGGGPDDPPDAAINTSHSNIKNLSEADDDADPGDDPAPAEGTIVKSKSNITNN